MKNRLLKNLLSIILVPVILAVCSLPFTVTDGEGDAESVMAAPVDYGYCASLLSAAHSKQIDIDFLKTLDGEAVSRLAEIAKTSVPTARDWHSLTGSSLNVLLGRRNGEEALDLGDNGKDSFTLGFVGDINFTEVGYVMPHAKTKPNGVVDCIDKAFLDEMRAADIMLANNEFTYSDTGTPLNKRYTFRAKPESVKYLDELGIDIVSLANNHVYDYSLPAFEDTLKTLENAGVATVGAGKDYSEASAPAIYYINGYKVAYLAASRVEVDMFTPSAGENRAGVMSINTADALAEEIRKAKSESDFVVVYLHWGIEYTTNLDSAQQEMSRIFAEAGADAVIGAHSHCLQGFDFYGDTCVAYSLGNFWFNTRTLDTAMLKLEFGSEKVRMSIVPGIQQNSEVDYISSAAKRRELYNRLEKISGGVAIDDNGVITPKA